MPGQLFTQYFLTDGIKTTTEWKRSDAEPGAFNAFRDKARQTGEDIRKPMTLDILHLPCCNETVKATRHERHFCVICGTEIDMTISDAKRGLSRSQGRDV